MVTAGIFRFKEYSHGRTGNRTRDLMISSQKLRPLDHEAGRILTNYALWKGTCGTWRIPFKCLTQTVCVEEQQALIEKQRP